MNLPTLELRPYQQLIIDNINDTTDNVIIRGDTGIGKSVIIERIAKQAVIRGLRVIIITPSIALVKNLQKRFNRAIATVAYTNHVPNLKHARVLITTNISAVKYMDSVSDDLIISDECHHIKAGSSWDRVIQKKIELNPNVRHIGFTATPLRLDGKGLYPWFNRIFNPYDISYYIKCGYLSNYRMFNYDTALHLSSGSDDLSEQTAQLLPHITEVYRHYQEKCIGRKTLIFGPTIDYCKALENLLVSNGVKAATLSSKSDPKYRQKTFKAFEQDELDVLLNVQLFTEGVDVPSVSAIILARFTYSVSLYRQMIGRALRPSEDDAIIIDLAGNNYYHGGIEAPVEWSLEDSKLVSKDNRSSLYNYCSECEAVLVSRRYVIESVKVSCLGCRTENTVLPILAAKDKRVIKAAKNIVGDVSEFDSTTLIELARVLRVIKPARTPIQTKVNTISGSKLPTELKVKLLTTLLG